MAILNNTDKNVHTTTISWDEQGVVEGSITYSIGASDAIKDALDTTVHPDHAYLKRTGGTVTFQEAGMAEVSISFTGIDPTNDGQVTTSIKATMTNEPIDTHPTFDVWSKEFAPIMNPDGSFKGFPIDPDNEMRGVKSYLDPSITYQQTTTYGIRSINQLKSGLDKIGFIDSSMQSGSGIPTAPKPTGDDGKKRNYLLISGSYEQIGEGGTVTKVWKLSGRRQWDDIMYTKGTD